MVGALESSLGLEIYSGIETSYRIVVDTLWNSSPESIHTGLITGYWVFDTLLFIIKNSTIHVSLNNVLLSFIRQCKKFITFLFRMFWVKYICIHFVSNSKCSKVTKVDIIIGHNQSCTLLRRNMSDRESDVLQTVKTWDWWLTDIVGWLVIQFSFFFLRFCKV